MQSPRSGDRHRMSDRRAALAATRRSESKHAQAATQSAQSRGRRKSVYSRASGVPGSGFQSYRQVTTGGKPRLLGISKRGNAYLRKNLVHGARAVLPKLAERDTPIGRWLRDLLGRQHKNVVVVALANKLARICWAVLAGHRGFVEEAVEMH